METLKNPLTDADDAAVDAAVERAAEVTAAPEKSVARRKSGSRNKSKLPRRFRRDFLMDLKGSERLALTLTADLRAIESDKGGVEEMSYAEQTLAQRAVWLAEVLRSHERRVAAGQPVELGMYVRGIQVLTNLHKTLGIRRRPKAAEGLHEYMRRRAEPPVEGGA